MKKRKPRAIDLTGQKFGRLTVVERAEDMSPGNVRWSCVCDCGNKTVAQSASLRSGRHLSCGCIQRESATRHGKEGSKEYLAWAAMKQRCLNPDNKSFRIYGGRGITVCDSWLLFENFYADMGDAPEGMSLDRIDNDRGYSPENCRWATVKVQSNNRRTSRVIEYMGASKTLTQWASEFGLSPISLTSRLKLGWDIHTALTKPIDRRKATRKKQSSPA